jgi:hypothetical protein
LAILEALLSSYQEEREVKVDHTDNCERADDLGPYQQKLGF